jgi:hypothetical protein
MRGVIVVVLVILAAPISFADPGADGLSVGDQWGESESGSVLNELSGSGVIIAVADTGIDLDHSCFRNSTGEVGEPGPSHRKILLLNNTIDDWDTQGHQQFRHGTHVAGILACDPLDGDISMRSISNASRLIVQDIVNSSGWVPPDRVETLLAEASANGAIINSWSWGDNTINYTDRSRTIDEWTVENPWSLIFVAPGNNGGMMLEPSNAYNVVSVAASDSEENGSMWPSSSHGPDVNGRRGTLISAPGMNILSAKADGAKFSFNNDSHAMTGTSMATPMAASFTALLQQMIEEEEGFSPSAPLLRALLASSAEPITGPDPDSIQGYGRPGLSSFENGVYVHDSYAVEDWVSVIQSRGGTLDSLKSNPWNGSGAAGPFLSENESWSRLFQPVAGKDVEIVMSYNARPMGQEIDDLRLVLKTSDGRFAVDDQLSSSGFSTFWYESMKNPLELNSSNETTVMIRVPADSLEGVEWLEVEVVANSILQGGNNGTLGINGTMLGFGIAATGVTDLTQNRGPDIVMNEGPVGGENYSDFVSINLTVDDYENDSFIVAIRLVNENFTIDLGDCAIVLHNASEILCEVDISRDLILYPILRHDWSFEIIAVDSNSSVWTEAKITTFNTENFTLWWNNPVLEEPRLPLPIEKSGESEFNLMLFWGISGIVVGVIVAASVMFRRFEGGALDSLLPPFREEE